MLLSAESALPPLYASWVGHVLDEPLPRESHATCSDCAMCKSAGQAATANAMTFSSRIKCCTYIPLLPNFLVGAVLDDDSVAARSGRVSVEQRIAAGTGVSPIGLGMSSAYALIYKHMGDELFGRGVALACPHYDSADGGRCTVWLHRNAVCATYFCKHERGATGASFWVALRELLQALEDRLALWCAAQLCDGLGKLGPAIMAYAGGTPPSAEASRADALRAFARDLDDAWGPRWLTRKIEFFRCSAELIRRLSWDELMEIGGPDLLARVNALRAAHARLSQPAPSDPLRLAPVQIATIDNASSAIAGYSVADMPIVPTHLVCALFQFDGRRSTAEIVEESHGLLDEAIVQRLVDFGVLTPMSDVSCGEANDVT